MRNQLYYLSIYVSIYLSIFYLPIYPFIYIIHAVTVTVTVEALNKGHFEDDINFVDWFREVFPFDRKVQNAL